jgi:hypothetical protein
MKLIFLFLLFVIASCEPASVENNKSKGVEVEYTLLGNPYNSIYNGGEKIYARNIWDMQLFDGKIYLGAGNSSNEGPAQNAGRVPLHCLDVETESFINEYEVAEEQIERFKVFNDILYIPGHDATQAWDFGNFYRYESDEWEKIRTIPEALHVYDLLIHDEKIITCGSVIGNSSVFISSDDGQTWNTYTLESGRVYSLFSLGVYIFAMLEFNSEKADWRGLYRWSEETGKFKRLDKYNASHIFPETQLETINIKMEKQVNIGESIYYIGSYSHNDHQGIPFAAYKMSIEQSGDLQISKVELPEQVTPRDLVYSEDALYLLATTSTEENYLITVYKIDTPGENEAEPLFYFSYNTFARSFEKQKNKFYFGMGCEINDPNNWDLSELNPGTGDILKVEL